MCGFENGAQTGVFNAVLECSKHACSVAEGEHGALGTELGERLGQSKREVVEVDECGAELVQECGNVVFEVFEVRPALWGGSRGMIGYQMQLL